MKKVRFIQIEVNLHSFISNQITYRFVTQISKKYVRLLFDTNKLYAETIKSCWKDKSIKV